MNVDADGKVCLVGPLTFSTVSAQLAASAALFTDRSRLCFDLSGVTAVDSAALALLVEWLRMGREHGVTVQFSQLSPALRSLGTVSELDQIDATLAMS
ncbi:MAG: STAS domain-containing protein [Immundisolibacter sp.]|uniref:STAS domain-containing protein n=1 Tax=Immundisolibacter sp. TaxID=1934948 RepID=UPI003EE13F25